jgi:mono/diheme cytochrome c family protein
MMRQVLVAAAAALSLTGVARAAPDGAALFNRCAACHLPSGDGLAGSFPSLHGQIARFAAVAAGRQYLVSVVTHGVAGPLSVAGVDYSNFMPGQGLADDEAAAVLNYLVGSIAAAKPPARPFTTQEVATIRARHPDATAQDSRALRPDSLAGR